MRAILLRIDMQEQEKKKFSKSPGAWNRIKGHGARLMTGLEEAGVPTMHVILIQQDAIPLACGTFKDVKDALDAANGPNLHMPGIRLDLTLTPQTLVGVKNTCSAHESWPIRRFVADNGFDTVIIDGVQEAENAILEGHCVSVTAEGFAKDGYDVIIAAEGTNLAVCRNTDFCSPEGMKRRQDFYNLPNVQVKLIDNIISMAAESHAARPSRAPRVLVQLPGSTAGL